jgi:Ca-activated chloride channel family protein
MTTIDEALPKPKRLSRKTRIILFFLVETVAAFLIGFAALFLNFSPAWSAESAPASLSKKSDARSGSLLFKTEDGYADATRLGIDVDLDVSGPTVRAKVTQIFRNPTRDWMEATYVYPLPPGGAVDTLKMVIGDRVVVGDIKERQQARVVYERAKANGEGGAHRAGAAEHLHQFGRQYRSRRDRAGADRISGAGAAERQRVLAARAAGDRTAL